MTKARKFKALMKDAPKDGLQREKWLRSQAWYWEFKAWTLGPGGKAYLERKINEY